MASFSSATHRKSAAFYPWLWFHRILLQIKHRIGLQISQYLPGCDYWFMTWIGFEQLINPSKWSWCKPQVLRDREIQAHRQRLSFPGTCFPRSMKLLATCTIPKVLKGLGIWYGFLWMKFLIFLTQGPFHDISEVPSKSSFATSSKRRWTLP